MRARLPVVRLCRRRAPSFGNNVLGRALRIATAGILLGIVTSLIATRLVASGVPQGTAGAMPALASQLRCQPFAGVLRLRKVERAKWALPTVDREVSLFVNPRTTIGSDTYPNPSQSDDS